MNKKVDFLATKYGITSLSNDNLQLFVWEIYDDGFHAGKETQQAFNTKITLRDHFAGLAMQKLSLAGHPTTAYKDLAMLSYQIAGAMLKAREVDDE